ncbi:MAG: diaminopimelate decarboxylase [Myxococcales bacterium]|nr:diaminopimelate decarboxylase [Myxococcales bacterium]
MHYFDYKGQELHCEEVSLHQIADEVGTPTYIYSKRTLERHFRAFDEPFSGCDHLICYSVKACSNIAILRLFARLGGGFDIVSAGELHRVLAAGGDPHKVVFSGVGKTEEEMRFALDQGILAFNVESEPELFALDRVARKMGRRAPVALRINPDVDAQTHPYISTGLKSNKFGIAIDHARRLLLEAKNLAGVEIMGIDSHIGSQLTKVEPFVHALERLLLFVDWVNQQGYSIRHLDLGGGLGITYKDETPPHPGEYATALLDVLGDRKLRLVFEPGRVIAGNAAILLTRVVYHKPTEAKNFVIVDGAMNDAIRPALYGAYHAVIPVRTSGGATETVDVVGPICETGDFLARDRELEVSAAGDLLAVMSAGAYGFSMSSNYNSRPRAAEVLVDGDRYAVIRQRETRDDLLRGESIPDWI